MYSTMGYSTTHGYRNDFGTRGLIARVVMMKLLLLVVASVDATRMLAFGDSWAWLGYSQFREVFAKHNISTSLHAIPGTPAAYWAKVQPNALIRAVDKHNATAVYLSIGGNDFLEGLPAGHLVDAIHREMLSSTRFMIDRLLAARPHVHIFHFGYELLDWGSDLLCKAFGALEMYGPKPLCRDVTNITCMTKAQATWLQTKFIDEGLAQIYKQQERYHPLNLLGTLQAAANISGAKIGAPVWSQFSPGEFVRNGLEPFGCVHLTPEGYTTLYNEFARQILPMLPPDPPDPGSGPDDVELPTKLPMEQDGDDDVEAVAYQHACISDPQRQCWVARKQSMLSGLFKSVLDWMSK